MVSRKNPTCSSCHWWKDAGQTSGDGTQCCTRFPPTLLGETGYEGCLTGVWPMTDGTCIACGEYRLREEGTNSRSAATNAEA